MDIIDATLLDALHTVTLRRLLHANGVSQCGEHGELVERCVRGIERGVPPACPRCTLLLPRLRSCANQRPPKLSWNGKEGEECRYTCPGIMTRTLAFHTCTIEAKEVALVPWTYAGIVAPIDCLCAAA